MTADGSVAGDAERTVRVRWNARLQPSMDEDPDDFTSYTATRGMAYVVFRLELANVVDREVTVRPYSEFGLQKDLCEATWFAEPSLFSIEQAFETAVPLAPDESTTGVVPFEVPRGLDRATLVRYVEADDDPPESTFVSECDRTLAIDIGLKEE